VGLAPLPCSGSWARHSEQHDPHKACFCATEQSPLACTHTDNRAPAKRLTAPPCSYTHAVFVTSFWLTFLVSVIGNIGYIYGEVDGIHAKDLPTFQKALVPNIVARLWLAVMMTFFPRFPDVWVSVPALLRVPVIFEEQVFLDLATSIPSIIYIGASAFGSCALLAIRLKLICTCLRDIRNRR